MPVMDSEVDVLVKTTADTAGATQTTAALEDMGAKAKLQSESAAASFEKFNKQLDTVSGQAVKVGRSMSEFVSLPIAAVGFESVKMATQFQQTMEMLHTNAGTAQKDIAGLSAEVLKMAPEVGAGPDKLAEAFYHIASAGNGLWDTAKQLDILKIAAEGAAIGQANLDDTTYALTSALASNVGGAKDASEMMAVLNATVGAGDMKLQDLNAAIGTGFLGTAETFGISIQSVGAALATLTDNGEHADAAATRLRMTWALMTAPSKQAAELLGQLGLNAEDAAVSTKGMSDIFAKTGLTTTKLADDLRQPNGMMVALKDLKDHLEAAGLSSSETDAILSKTFGGGRTDAALLSLLGNLDRMDEKFKLINQNTSKFGDNWAAQQQTANQQFHEAWAGIEASLIKLGDEVMPAATKIMKEFSGDIQDVAHWFGSLTKGQQEFILKTAAIAAVAGPAILILGKLGKAASETATLFLTLGKAVGLFKTEGMIAQAAKGASALGKGAGLLGAVEGLAPEAAGLGAILSGPVVLGLAGVVAAGITTAVIVHKLSETHKEAAKHAVEQTAAEKKVADQLLTSQGAYKVAQKNIDDYTKASSTEQSTNDKKVAAYAGIQKAQGLYNTAVSTTSEVLKKYGRDSPQYLEALEKEAAANTNLGKATDAYNKLADAATKAHDSVNKAAGNLNATYYTSQQYTAKYNSDTKALTDAKNKEHDAHDKVTEAAKGYTAALLLTGPQSETTRKAAENLTTAKDKETKSQQSVSWWTQQVRKDLDNEKASAQNLGGAIDNLASKNSKLTGILNKSSGSGSLPQFASGVQNFGGGAAIVGEQGPELVYLPPGSDVIPSDQTRAMLTPQTGGGNISHSSSSSVVIQQLIVNTTQPMSQVLRDLDQENILVSRGMTPNRGYR